MSIGAGDKYVPYLKRGSKTWKIPRRPKGEGVDTPYLRFPLPTQDTPIPY